MRRASSPNELSASKIEEMLRVAFPDTQAWHIPTFLKQNFDCAHYYNKKAYTIIARRWPDGGSDLE